MLRPWLAWTSRCNGGASRCKDDAAQASAENDLNGSPRLPRQRVQVARKCNSRQEIGKEDVDGARNHLLIEDGPIREIPSLQVHQVLSQEPERPEVASWTKVESPFGPLTLVGMLVVRRWQG